MLEDGARLVLLDPLGHHVHNVVHHGGTQLQVKVGLHALLRHCLGHSWRQREGWVSLVPLVLL